MSVVFYLQNEHTKEMHEHFFWRLGHNEGKAKYFFTHKEDEDEDEDCGEANLQTLIATESHHGAPSRTQKEGNELRDYPNQVFKPHTERSIRALYRHFLKQDKLHGRFDTLKGKLNKLGAYIEKTDDDINLFLLLVLIAVR
jgi:hypothetical protein